MLVINFVSELEPALFAREADRYPGVDFNYSSAPIGSALNVFYGPQANEVSLDIRKSSFFVMTEPPEICRWPLEYLRCFRLVLGPNFRYTRNLSNFFRADGLLPWRIGVAHEIGQDRPTLSRADIADLGLPDRDLVTTVVSSKKGTRMQRERIALTRYLEEHLDGFIVFGRDDNFIADKKDALVMGRYHLAVENSAHEGSFTEKLADPLLVGNTVFYGGHRKSLRGLNRRTIIAIDASRPKAVLEIIKRTRNEGETSESMSAKLENRNLILRDFNLHRQVVAAAQVAGFFH